MTLAWHSYNLHKESCPQHRSSWTWPLSCVNPHANDRGERRCVENWWCSTSWGTGAQGISWNKDLQEVVKHLWKTSQEIPIANRLCLGGKAFLCSRIILNFWLPESMFIGQSPGGSKGANWSQVQPVWPPVEVFPFALKSTPPSRWLTFTPIKGFREYPGGRAGNGIRLRFLRLFTVLQSKHSQDFGHALHALTQSNKHCVPETTSFTMP